MTHRRITQVTTLLITAGLAFLLAAGCSQPAGESASSAAPSPLDQQLDSYDTQMTALAEMLKTSDDLAAINDATRDLMETSVGIIEGYIALKPACAAYLNASLGVLDELETISGEAIETQYHLDGALPEGDSDCYHVKDLLVHPATVLVIIRERGLDAARDQARNEILENTGHLIAVREAVKAAQG